MSTSENNTELTEIIPTPSWYYQPKLLQILENGTVNFSTLSCIEKAAFGPLSPHMYLGK
jgi:hypothetical protein